EEENFIFELKKKNEKALYYVIDNHGWIIKSVVKKHLYNLQSIQDECINDILLGIWNNIEKFDSSKGSFKNWIAGISKFKCIDYKRK
ncbi:sigma factor, partial [Clostridium sp. ZBS14]